MNGELGMVISHLEITKPDEKGNTDLFIHNKDGSFLWLVGNNDWKELFENIKPWHNER